jgi:2-keto-4-pentenoate hydratase/2-oxohepta-3-ene-1,7-dioic acid hydratase in catechol pathway
MRLATYQTGRETALGVIVDDRLVDLRAVARRRKTSVPTDMVELIEAVPTTSLVRFFRDAASWVQDGRTSVPLSRAKLLAPIPRPRKNIFCVGRNYTEHIRETGSATPDAPMFFTKPPTSVIGPHAPILYHPATQQLDYEVELAAVIGRRGRDIPVAKALDYVFGYTILNDVTARDLQRRHGQWFKGKALDTFAPLGPWIVHRAALSDPQQLRLSLRVNGETRQNSTTSKMIFTVAQLIATLSEGLTLEPGDILATGTPEGIGMGFTPPRFLHVGDTVEAEVEGIGILRNLVAAPPP